MKYQKHTGKRDYNIEQTVRLLWMCGLCYNKETQTSHLNKCLCTLKIQ